MTDKQIMIDGVNVSRCKNYRPKDRFTCYPYICNCHQKPDCYYKQLQRKEQECIMLEEEKSEKINLLEQVIIALYPNADDDELFEVAFNAEFIDKVKTIAQECEELKKQLMQKSEVDMFFNTPIEGWSNDPCGICPHKAENEELKKEIIDKNEKIKELRFSVSDLTNRLCYLNAEKSFRIVDLEQALDEIAAHYQKVIKNITTYDDSYDASISIEALHNISNIINKAKGEGNANSSIITFSCTDTCCSSRNAARTSKGTKSN